MYNLTVQLVKKEDVSIDYLLFEDTEAPDLELEMIAMGCKVYKVPKPINAKSLVQCTKGLDVFFAQHNEYDVIHIHTSTKAVLPLYYAKKHGIKLRIMHSHCTGFQTTNKVAIFIGNLLKAPVCRLANDYFACTKIAGDWLFKNFFAKRNVEVKILNNGIIPHKFTFDPLVRQTVRSELNLEDHTVVIGHVGGFRYQKNHPFIIDAFEDYHKFNSDSKLLLVGYGDCMEATKEKVAQKRLENSVVFLGQRIDVNRFYQAFDLFFMPSLYEGLPFVGIEAQAADLPCLFSDTITKKVKILDSIKFLSLSLPLHEWTKTIQSMVKKKKRRNVVKELTDAGYNIENEAEKLYQYYKRQINTLNK